MHGWESIKLWHFHFVPVFYMEIYTQVLRYNTGSAIRPKNSCQMWLLQCHATSPARLHETSLFEFSDETSGFKIDFFNPKCNQHWRSQFLSESFHATKMVAFRIEGVNFDAASGVTVTQLFFWMMVGPWTGPRLREMYACCCCLAKQFRLLVHVCTVETEYKVVWLQSVTM